MDYTIGQLLLNKYDKTIYKITGSNLIKDEYREFWFKLSNVDYIQASPKYLYKQQLDEHYVKIDNIELARILYEI
jgi:hypothetical protein